MVFDQRRLLLWMIYYKVSEDIRKILPQLSVVLVQQYILGQEDLLLSFGTFNSFLAGPERNCLLLGPNGKVLLMPRKVSCADSWVIAGNLL